MVTVAETFNYQLQLVWQPFLDRDILARVVQALVNSTLDYYKTLYKGIPLGLVCRIQFGQNAEARLPSEVSYQEHVTTGLNDFHCLTINTILFEDVTFVL